ncbi:MAG: LPS export ABC transporter ATP-binding protein [Nitrospirae bacterium]|nr:LPS export ABC transporter ATP-binding protein [Candidatus Troglogloeales bacterium]MBI3598036.1 LPS export ABC transporter ATP-binding protein [Candidatus Troglogloeales bacterium]
MLEAIGLKKYYKKREVVRGVSLQVRPGEVVGFLGPNGAGKTTLFQMIAGLTFPSAGEVLLNNEKITTMPLYRRARLGLGYLPQEPSIFRKMTVEENILAILQMQFSGSNTTHVNGNRLSAAAMRVRVEALLGELNLLHLSKRIASTLSGGERRRLEITRALTHHPSFLLLDEPFSGIDPIVVIEIQKVLFQLKEKGIGIFITDHNVDETLSVCDRAYIIHGGEILLSGTPSEIAKNPVARERYLGNRFLQ